MTRLPTVRVASMPVSLKEQGEVRETDAPLAMRSVAGAVLGILVLGLLDDEEINSRSQEVPDVLAGLLLHGHDVTKGGQHG
jgi:hypothetical protein